MAALIHGCDDGPLPTAVDGPEFLIADAAHDGDNPDFFFLPPLVPDPTGHEAFDAGGFDDGQSPEVHICALEGTACAATQPDGFPITYSMTTGAGDEAVRLGVPPEEHYVVNWHTDGLPLDTAVTYRITVSVAGTELGFADIDAVGNGRELKNVVTGQYIPLQDGRTLPIRFRIEHGAVYVVDATATTVTALGGKVTLDIPANAVTGVLGLTVRPASGYADPPLVAGTAYAFGPDGLTFAAPVALTITYDEPLPDGMDESSLRIYKLAGSAWDLVPDGVVDPDANAATVAIDGFSTYAIAEEALVPIPAEHRVIFVSNRGGNLDLYGLGLGLTARQLTDDPSADDHPAISPDGTRIAFSSTRDGDWEIYVMDVAGTTVQQLTFNDADDRHSSWSPDGSRIAFVTTRDGDWEVYVMNADGSGQRNLTNYPDAADWAPDWSPNGRDLVFTSSRDGGDHDVFVMDTGTGEILFQLTHNDAEDLQPNWSPYGNYVAYSSNQHGHYDIFKIQLGWPYSQRLTYTAGMDAQPVWCPWGRHILFMTTRDGNREIYVMNQDGSGQTNLTNHSAYDNRPEWGVLAASQPAPLLTVLGDPFVTRLIARLPESLAADVDVAIDRILAAVMWGDAAEVSAALVAAKGLVADGSAFTEVERAYLDLVFDYGLSVLN